MSTPSKETIADEGTRKVLEFIHYNWEITEESHQEEFDFVKSAFFSAIDKATEPLKAEIAQLVRQWEAANRAWNMELERPGSSIGESRAARPQELSDKERLDWLESRHRLIRKAIDAAHNAILKP